MPVEYFVRYQGKCYDVGTRLKYKTGEGLFEIIYEGTIEWISHNHIYIRLVDGTGMMLSKIHGLDKTIIEIIHPVYYEEPLKKPVRGGTIPSYNDMFIGWVWYIVIMLVGVIFNDRWLIWIFATIIFFTWKNGLWR